MRVKTKFTVKNPVCCRRGLLQSEFLTVILALTLKSGVALMRVKAKFTVKSAVCQTLPLAAYGESDCAFDFASHE